MAANGMATQGRRPEPEQLASDPASDEVDAAKRDRAEHQHVEEHDHRECAEEVGTRDERDRCEDHRPPEPTYGRRELAVAQEPPVVVYQS